MGKQGLPTTTKPWYHAGDMAEARISWKLTILPKLRKLALRQAKRYGRTNGEYIEGLVEANAGRAYPLAGRPVADLAQPAAQLGSMVATARAALSAGNLGLVGGYLDNMDKVVEAILAAIDLDLAALVDRQSTQRYRSAGGQGELPDHAESDPTA